MTHEHPLHNGRNDGRTDRAGQEPLPWLADAHLDLAWNALQWNRDLCEDVHVTRVREASEVGPGRGRNTVALPDMRRGGVRLLFGTLLARCSGVAKAHIDYSSPEQANAAAWGQLAYYRALERRAHLRVIADRAALDDHVRYADGGGDTPGLVVAMEGADPILEPDELPAWTRAGLRLLGLTHYGPGRYAGGTGTGRGLTDLGRALLDAMTRERLILDLTHLSDKGFWEALERFPGLIHVSHANCRALVPHQRQLDDAQLRAIASRGGVVGVALDAWMLVPGWVKGASRPDGLTLRHVADHIDYICQLLGSSRFVGIGSDLDGGFGREQCPEDLDTIADLRLLAPILYQRGYTREDVADIFHGNWVRLLRQHWGESPSDPPRLAHRHFSDS